MVIGLLGGVGSGKSTAAGLFEEIGAEVVDADRLAHEVLRGPAASRKVAERFGPEVLGPDGEVDRRRLGERVFSDRKALEDLEAIVHPPVLEAVRERIRRHRRAAGGLPAPLLVLDVPLLAESPLRGECDAFVFVDAGLAERRSRTAPRGWAPGDLDRREKHQLPIEEKRRLARWVADNSGSIDRLRSEIARIGAEARSMGAHGGIPGRPPGAGKTV